MTDNKLKIFHDSDTSTIKIQDNMRLNTEKVKLVSSDNLKTNQYNSNSYMKPNLNEEIHRTDDNVKANFKILENDINLLANPKKTKKFSSDEEDSSSEDSSSDISTEEDTDHNVSHDTKLIG